MTVIFINIKPVIQGLIWIKKIHFNIIVSSTELICIFTALLNALAF